MTLTPLPKRTSRTDLPIEWRYWAGGTSGTQRAEVSYLCTEGKHERCTGLISPGGHSAYMCGCRVRSCICTERARG